MVVPHCVTVRYGTLPFCWYVQLSPLWFGTPVPVPLGGSGGELGGDRPTIKSRRREEVHDQAKGRITVEQ